MEKEVEFIPSTELLKAIDEMNAICERIRKAVAVMCKVDTGLQPDTLRGISRTSYTFAHNLAKASYEREVKAHTEALRKVFHPLPRPIPPGETIENMLKSTPPSSPSQPAPSQKSTTRKSSRAKRAKARA